MKIIPALLFTFILTQMANAFELPEDLAQRYPRLAFACKYIKKAPEGFIEFISEHNPAAQWGNEYAFYDGSAMDNKDSNSLPDYWNRILVKHLETLSEYYLNGSPLAPFFYALRTWMLSENMHSLNAWMFKEYDIPRLPDIEKLRRLLLSQPDLIDPFIEILNASTQKGSAFTYHLLLSIPIIETNNIPELNVPALNIGFLQFLLSKIKTLNEIFLKLINRNNKISATVLLCRILFIPKNLQALDNILANIEQLLLDESSLFNDLEAAVQRSAGQPIKLCGDLRDNMLICLGRENLQAFRDFFSVASTSSSSALDYTCPSLDAAQSPSDNDQLNNPVARWASLMLSLPTFIAVKKEGN